MTTTLNFGIVAGLTAAEQQQLSDLAEAYTYHQSHNATKDKYYEGHVTLRDVNLGIALPTGLRGLEVGCSWGQKAVDVLAARSMFDGFVGTGGTLCALCAAGAVSAGGAGQPAVAAGGRPPCAGQCGDPIGRYAG